MCDTRPKYILNDYQIKEIINKLKYERIYGK